MALPVPKQNWKQLFIYLCEKDGKEVFLSFDFTEVFLSFDFTAEADEGYDYILFS